MLALATGGCESGDRAAVSDDRRNDPHRTSSPSFGLSDEPDVVIGVAGGRPEQELFEVAGAARLSDGSIIIYEAGAFRLQKFGPDGEHLWSRGQSGEGPGDFANLAQLLAPCASDRSIVMNDRYNGRIAVFDGDGALLRTYPFAFQGHMPYDITCAPGGRLVVSGWALELPAEPGPFRTAVDMAFADSSEVTILREGVLAEDRVATADDAGNVGGSAPALWSRRLRFAATDEGIWLGTGDDFELEFLDWTGTTIRTVRWEGTDRTVSQGHMDTHYEAVRDSFAGGLDYMARNFAELLGSRGWEERFEARWERDRAGMPSAFPAYGRVLLGDDGALWIEDYPRPAQQSEWYVVNDDGERTRRLDLPPGIVLLDIGADWVLVTYRDRMDVERVALYSLVEN